MAIPQGVHIELELTSLPSSEVRVLGFQGLEELGWGYRFSIALLPLHGEALDASEILGSPAALTLGSEHAAPRHIHGMVSELHLSGLHDNRPRYLLQLVPRYFRLNQMRRSRIFQNLSVPQIAERVLRAHQVDHALELTHNYIQREFCVQYRESDFDFLQRLLQEEGIFHLFRHSADAHQMVLLDAVDGCPELPGGHALPFRPSGGQVADEEHVFRLESGQRIRPGRSAIRDYDFERPSLDLTSSASFSEPFKFEVYDYPDGYVIPAEGKRRARVRLDEARVESHTVFGGSSSPRMFAGACFEVADQPAPMAEGKLVALRVLHHGSRQAEDLDGHTGLDLYRNELVALSADRPFRPARTLRRPVIPGIQTATVVGPGGDEIHPDRYGRIKVQFHWDREGTRDDHSSCWVQVAQRWAGPSFGASFIPRIGQEVVVRFLEGSPDRPLVVGAVYNGQHPPPIALPGEKTKSTLRSDSSPGGGGSNELRVEDARGEEQVFLHGQKDENIVVENDKQQRVGRDEALEVIRDRSRIIDGNQMLRVNLDDSSRIGGNQSLQVGGNRTTSVAQNQGEEVKGNQSVAIASSQDVSVAAATAMTVGAAAALSAGGGYFLNIGGAHSEVVGGLRSSEIAGARVDVVGLSRQESVGGDASYKTGGQLAIQVEDKAGLEVSEDSGEEIGGKSDLAVKESILWSGEKVKFSADKFTLVVNGKVALAVEKSGKVTFYGKTISVEGDAFKFKGANIKKVPTPEALSQSVKIKKLDDLEKPKGVVRATYVAPDGGPGMAGLNFELKQPDGKTAKGKVAPDGSVSVPGVVPGSCTLVFKLPDGPKKKKESAKK